MEFCRICGKPIEKKLYVLEYEGRRIDDVCNICSAQINVLKSCQNGKSQFSYPIIADGQNWARGILADPQIKEEGKTIVQNIDKVMLSSLQEYRTSDKNHYIGNVRFSWRGIVTITSVLWIVIYTVLGSALGVILSTPLVQTGSLDADGAIFIGGVIGFLLGLAKVSYNMMIANIDKNLSEILEVYKSDKK